MRKRHVDGWVIATRAWAGVGDEGNVLRQPRAHLVWLVDPQQHVLRVGQVRVAAQHHALDVVGFERVTGSVDVLVPGLERSESTQPQARRIVGARQVEETASNVIVVVDVCYRQCGIGAIPGVPDRHARARPRLEARPVERPGEAHAAGPDRDDTVVESGNEVVEVCFPAAVVVAEKHQGLLFRVAFCFEVENRPVSEMNGVQAGQPPGCDVGKPCSIDQIEEPEDDSSDEPRHPSRFEDDEAGHLVLNLGGVVLELPDSADFLFLSGRRSLEPPSSGQPAPEQPLRDDQSDQRKENRACPAVVPEPIDAPATQRYQG